VNSSEAAENTDPGHKKQPEKQLLKSTAQNPTLGHRSRAPGDFPDSVLKCLLYPETNDHTSVSGLNLLPPRFQVILAVGKTFFCLQKRAVARGSVNYSFI